MSRRALVFLGVLLLTGCKGGGCSPTPKPPPGPPTPAIPTATNGLQGQERSRWHHLAEGSEVYPVAWLLALEDPSTGKPFLENPERFGLLREDPSPENPYGLPIGLTADYTRDLRFAGVQMTGINCAACHVNEMHLKGKPVVRIDGAPNLFDVELFFGELARATIDTFKDLNKAWRFTVRLYQVYHPAEGEKKMVRLPRPADDVLRSFKTFGTLLEHGDFEKKLAAHLQAIHKQELARPPLDLRAGLVVRPVGPALVDYLKAVKKKGDRKRVALTKDLGAAATTVRHKSIAAVKAPDMSVLLDTTPSKANPLNKLSAAERASAVTDALIHFTETLRLLKARAAFLAQLARSSTLDHTPPGFGRVDAFGTARNLFFPNDVKPTTSPISYPHLWGLNQLVWLHWDANTTSLMERNAGQAIGLGALFDPKTFDSTLIVEHLEELETLARKIERPIWPKAFGAIDQDKAKRGGAIYENRCAKCHKPLGPGDKVADVLAPLDKIETDPKRAESFDQDVGKTKFDDALSAVLKSLVNRAGGRTDPKKLWRLTRSYANRPLVAPWATAPYLHNNSVPTLHHLLLPADQRPGTFPVGHREFDPVKLGYTTARPGTPTFPFDTTKPGNSNAGHTGAKYGTDLSPQQREELLEYLKTL